VVHYSCGPFAAENTLIDGMIGVAVDVTDFPVTQMHTYAASARTHIAGGSFDDVANGF
jgi:hypothetical protein